MAKKLSPAMFAWAKANKSKLKNPTPAQEKIFAAYAAMVKAGDKPANPKPRPTPKAAPKTQAAKTKPRQTTPEEAKERFYRSSSQGTIAQNQAKAQSNFFRSSSGTRGENMPSNPQLKSKPKRSDFPAGRAGQAKYAAALRNYNKKPAKPRRAALTMEQRRRARRSTNR